MALIKCEECGAEVSSKAKTCPKCGVKVAANQSGCGTLIGVIILGGIIYSLSSIFSSDTGSGTSSSPTSSPVVSASKRSAPSDCDASSKITGIKYNVIGSGIKIRKGPNESSDQIINQKATSILNRTEYITIDDTTTVFEECMKGEWSWIRVVEPEWLQDSHRGWVMSKFLDKGQDIGGDKYTRKISSSALLPYTEPSDPIITKYGSRLREIETLRRKAAEIAVDSGKCDYVLMSELSDSKSDLKHLYFWVDCKNGQRINLDETQIKKGSTVLTQEEKSWTKESALAACRDAIKVRALIPSEVDIHNILGTSFYKAPTTHNVVLQMNFDAKNALGAEVPYTAICYFAPGEVGTIEIQPRL